MSTIKSSDEHLTLNADGNSKDIKLQSNGSEKVIIKSDGKVGISTSAPSTNLEVEADDNSTTTFPVKVINSAGTGSTQIGAYAIDTTSVDLTLKAGGNTALTVDKDNGNVLIGEDSGDAFNADSMLRLQRTGDRVYMQFKTDADQESGILFGDVDDDVECAIEYEPANKALTFSAGNNAEAMRLDSTGNVGINTDSPSFPLHVDGTIKSVGTNNLPALVVDGNSTNEGDIACLDGQALTFGHHTLDGNTGGFTMAMKIHSNGAVVKPLQPAFSVIKSSDQPMTSGGEIQVTFQTEEFDVGSNFASNVFTAPVSGKYFLHAIIRIDVMDKDASYYRTGIVTSNKSKYEIMEPDFASDPSYFTMSVASVFDMDAGDTAQARVRQNSGTASHIDDTQNYTNFCGYLLG